MARYARPLRQKHIQHANVSVAYALPEPEYVPVKRKRKRPKRINIKPVYIYADNRQHKLSFMQVMTVVIIFIGLICVTFTHVLAKDGSRYVASLNEQLKARQALVSELEEEITLTINLDEIEQIAKTDLGMSKPKPYQVKHISVDKGSYVVSQRDAIEEAPEFRLSTEFFKDLIHRIIGDTA